MKPDTNPRVELSEARDDLAADLKLLAILENGHSASLFRSLNELQEATRITQKKTEESLKRYIAAWTRKEAAGG